MSPLDIGICPFCNTGEIPGEKLIEGGIKQGDIFECPICSSPLRYTLIKQFPAAKILVHYAGDPKDMYGEESWGAKRDRKIPGAHTIRRVY